VTFSPSMQDTIHRAEPPPGTQATMDTSQRMKNSKNYAIASPTVVSLFVPQVLVCSTHRNVFFEANQS
jgi:hypothetical protein